MTDKASVARSYDEIAADYTAQIAGELAGKPLDRALLEAFAEQVRGLGPVADLGCGPGHVAAFLANAGCRTLGFDLSEGMVAQAREHVPAAEFQQGDLRSLPVEDEALGGIVAFYSVIHIAPDELLPAFREWHRVLRPNGRVLVAFHIGDEIIHLDEWWGKAVDLDFRFLQFDAVVAALTEAGFAIEATLRRAPYPDVEHPSQRGYVQARK